jgi:hypothetical protein
MLAIRLTIENKGCHQFSSEQMKPQFYFGNSDVAGDSEHHAQELGVENKTRKRANMIRKSETGIESNVKITSRRYWTILRRESWQGFSLQIASRHLQRGWSQRVGIQMLTEHDVAEHAVILPTSIG